MYLKTTLLTSKLEPMWSSLIENTLYQQVTKEMPDLPTLYFHQSLENKVPYAGIEMRGRKYILLCDEITADIFALSLHAQLTRHGADVTLHTLPAHTQASLAVVEEIQRSCEQAHNYAFIAVGSGTINDLAKHISYTTNSSYILFPTAPSMNGYASSSTSLMDETHNKQSYQAHLPSAIHCILPILMNAPERMYRAGIGDSVARMTAQADWYVAHMKKNSPYSELPFLIQAQAEQTVFNIIENHGMDRQRLCMPLMQLLLLSGLGMTLCNGSYPASQGEHAIGHIIDKLVNQHTGHPLLHGEIIGVTTLTMLRIQHHILTTHKDLHSSIRAMLLPVATVEAMLTTIGAPTSPHELGMDIDSYIEAVCQARSLRPRFGFLNMVDDATIARIVSETYAHSNG